jgi:hypothetical protein
VAYAIAFAAILFPRRCDPQSLRPIVTKIGHSTLLVEQKEISVVRALAGHVVVLGTGAPASGVTVDLCNSGWKAVLASTKTDERGYFSLGKQEAGKLLYVRLSSPGMDIYRSEFALRSMQHMS